jgi:hypothetical protein
MQAPGRWARFVPKRRADGVVAAGVLVAGTAIGTEVLDRSLGQLVAYHGSVCALRVTRDRINYSVQVQMHRAQRRACAPSASASHLVPRGDSVVAPYGKRNHATPRVSPLLRGPRIVTALDRRLPGSEIITTDTGHLVRIDDPDVVVNAGTARPAQRLLQLCPPAPAGDLT